MFEPTPENWSPQSELIGGAPGDTDLAALLTDWFQKRGGPAATWRLQVSLMDGDDGEVVVAAVEVEFTQAVERQVKRLGPPPAPIAPTFWTTVDLQPPSQTQLRARAKRDARATQPEAPPS
jgi:hypothetical protein